MTRTELNQAISSMSLDDAKKFAKSHGFKAAYVVVGAIGDTNKPFYRDEDALKTASFDESFTIIWDGR